MISQEIQFFDAIILIRRTLLKFIFIQPQVMRDTTVGRFFMARGQSSSRIMEWKLNQMDQIYYLTFQRGKWTTINHRIQFKYVV